MFAMPIDHRINRWTPRKVLLVFGERIHHRDGTALVFMTKRVAQTLSSQGIPEIVVNVSRRLRAIVNQDNRILYARRCAAVGC